MPTRQARPRVQSKGKWVALDHADLAEAAAALAERADTNQLTGAEMLRHALGLEGGCELLREIETRATSPAASGRAGRCHRRSPRPTS